MLRTQCSRPALTDLAPALARQWSGLDHGQSPFLSWDWVGCLAAKRYPDPLLIQTFDGEALVGLALFNRRRTPLERRLYLHESGEAALDSVFIEHNGVVAAPGQRAAVLAATLACALRQASRVVLGGIDDAALAVVRRAGLVGRLQTRPAPFLPLPPGGALLPLLSRNTRAQLRRSDRAYAARGPLVVEQASTVAEALDWLGRLLPWHDATWRSRGIVSGFMAEPVQRFHRALIRRSLSAADGTVALLRISAGNQVVGYLLNLRAGGRMAAYQGGFDYAGAPAHGKPGLSCHAAAIGAAWSAGCTEYDFLAGDGRYKRSLSTESRGLHWLELCRPASLAGLEAVARRLTGR